MKRISNYVLLTTVALIFMDISSQSVLKNRKKQSSLMQFDSALQTGNISNSDLIVCKPKDNCDPDVDAFLFVDMKIVYKAIIYIEQVFKEVLKNQKNQWTSDSNNDDVPMVETVLDSYKSRVERYLRTAPQEFTLKDGETLTYVNFFEFSRNAQGYLFNSTITYIKYYTFHMIKMSPKAQNVTSQAMSEVVRDEVKRIAKFEKEMLCDVLDICEDGHHRDNDDDSYDDVARYVNDE